MKQKKPANVSIDSSFATSQRDLFESGIAAQIGMNAFGVWIALKHHANYSTGKAYPGVRRLAELVGLNKDTISRCLHTLEDAKLLRSTPRGRGKNYYARERLDVRVGSAIACTILVDYVPATVRKKLQGIEDALQGGKDFSDDAFAQVEILPGPGFVWDATSKSLKGRALKSDLAAAPDPYLEDFNALIASKRLPDWVPKK